MGNENRRLTAIELLILGAVPLTVGIILVIVALSRPAQLPPGRQDQRAYYETVVPQEKAAMDIAVKAAQPSSQSSSSGSPTERTSATSGGDEREKETPKPESENKGGAEPGN